MTDDLQQEIEHLKAEIAQLKATTAVPVAQYQMLTEFCIREGIRQGHTGSQVAGVIKAFEQLKARLIEAEAIKNPPHS